MRYIEKYGAYFEIVDGKLYDAPAMLYECDGCGQRECFLYSSRLGFCDCCCVRPDPDKWGEVTAPQVMGELATDFLKDINEIFGTNYTLDQFDGR